VAAGAYHTVGLKADGTVVAMGYNDYGQCNLFDWNLLYGSTIIELSSFTANPSDKKVFISWTTASEIDNAGFNLYRAESENGEYVKINASLIPAEGSPTQSATYEFIDENVRNRTTYYKLEDIDLNGQGTIHGPVSATPRIIY